MPETRNQLLEKIANLEREKRFLMEQIESETTKLVKDKNTWHDIALGFAIVCWDLRDRLDCEDNKIDLRQIELNLKAFMKNSPKGYLEGIMIQEE